MASAAHVKLISRAIGKNKLDHLWVLTRAAKRGSVGVSEQLSREKLSKRQRTWSGATELLIAR